MFQPCTLPVKLEGDEGSPSWNRFMGFDRRRLPFQASVFGCLIALIVIVLTRVVIGAVVIVMFVGSNSSGTLDPDSGGGSGPDSAPVSSGRGSSGG